MAKNSKLDVDVDVDGIHKLTRLERKLARLAAVTKGYKSQSTRSLETVNTKWRKHFDTLDKGIQMMGKGFTKLVTGGAKFATLQIGLLGGAMMALHASFVLGNAAMKAFRWLAKGAAGAAAGLAVAASTAAAAIREQQIAMFSFKGGKNYQNASVMMRQLAADSQFAAVGAESVQAAFAAISKTSTFTAGSSNLLKGLLDFAAAGKPLEEGMKAAGNFVAKLQDPKATFTQIKEAAKELGPEMERALEEAGKKGVNTAEKLKKEILSGGLSAAGGVAGQFDAVNDTLITRFKSSFNLIKNMFADFGDPFLQPVKNVLEDVVRIFKRTFDRVAGDIALFAQGKFFGDIVSVTDKLGNWFVNFIRNYLPKIEGMFSSIGDWWRNFKDGWNNILDKLRPLIDGARVLEETLMRILRPIGQMLKEGFGDVNEMLITNEDKFYAFGDAIGRFIVTLSKFAKTVREIFVDALPFITKAIDGLTTLVDLFFSLLGGFRTLLGGSSFGSFGLLISLLSAGRSMKKTTGGVISNYGIQMGKSGKGSRLTGQTEGGNVSSEGAAAAKAMQQMSKQVARQQVAMMTVGTMTVGNQGAGGMGGMASSRSARGMSPEAQAKREAMRAQRLAGINAAKQQALLTPGGMIRYQTQSGQTAAMRNNAFNRNFRLSADARQQLTVDPNYVGPGRYFRDMRQNFFRQPRESYAFKRMFGGEVGKPGEAGYRNFKGLNNSMVGTMGASVGLGLLSNVMPQESQGALALGSMVGAFNPLAGLAVGVVGGLITGIRGAAKRRKKEAIAEAKKQGEEFLSTQIEGFQEGMSNLISQGNLTKNRVELERQKIRDAYSTRQGQLDSVIMSSLNDRGRAALAYGAAGGKDTAFMKGATNVNELTALDRSGFDVIKESDLKEIAEKQRLSGVGIFGEMTAEQYEEASKNLEAFVTAQQEINRINQTALDLTFEFGDQRMTELGRVFNKTDLEIMKMADEIGINLYDSTVTTTEQIKQLGKAMKDTSKELFDSAADRYAAGTDRFRKRLEEREARQALDEGAFALRGQFNELLAGGLSESDFTDILLNYADQTRQQMVAFYKGDVQLAEEEFARQFGRDGTVWKTAGGALEGMGDIVYNLIGGELEGTIADAEAGRNKDLEEFVRANILKGGQQISGDVLGLVSSLGTVGRQSLQSFISGTDVSTASGQEELMAYLNSIPNIEDFGISIKPYIEPQLAAAQEMKKASETFKNAAISFEGATGQIIEKLAPTGGDTSSPIGDRLSSTLSTHNALSSSIPGRRSITSGYRNYALGSINSDHVTGRALDLTGQNLVSYRDKMTSAGGFAEFHGKGDSRHLHVVPPTQRAIGDSMTAVSATSANVQSSQGGGRMVSNTNNFYITGNNPEEIANVVMRRIAQVNKSNDERR